MLEYFCLKMETVCKKAAEHFVRLCSVTNFLQCTIAVNRGEIR